MGAVRTAVASLALFGLAAHAENGTTKPRVSANGVYAISFTQTGPDSCAVEVNREQDKAWSLPKCVGNPGDLYFVSNTGERFWVLRTLPEKPAPRPQPKAKKGKRKPKKVDPLLTAEVATLYDRNGQVLASHTLAEYLPPKMVSELRELGHHFLWLEGVSGMPGRVPRLNDAAEVEFEAVQQKTRKLSFDPGK